jgi:hypothetical protein
MMSFFMSVFLLGATRRLFDGNTFFLESIDLHILAVPLVAEVDHTGSAFSGIDGKDEPVG